MVQNYPEGLLKAFNVDMTAFSTSFNAFLAAENFSFMWPILAIMIGIGYGSASIAGEIEKGTIEIMLAMPVSRLKIFFSKYLAGIFGITIFTVLSITSIYLLATAFSVESSLGGVLAMTALGLLFAGAIFSLTMLFSTLFSEKGKASMSVLGIILPMYALNLVASLQENLNGLKYLSFFYYFDANNALLNNTITGTTLIIFGLTIIGTTITAAVRFMKRDVAI